jgi:hypothetical protein
VPVAGLLIALAVYLGAPARAMVLVMFALIFFMLIPWGYFRTPANGLVLTLLTVLLLASAWLLSPILLTVMAASLGLYAATGHLPGLKRMKVTRHYA